MFNIISVILFGSFQQELLRIKRSVLQSPAGSDAQVTKPIQWGSEIRPFKIQKHLKSRLFEDQISSGPVIKESGNSFCYSIQKQDHSKSRHFCPALKQRNPFALYAQAQLLRYKKLLKSWALRFMPYTQLYEIDPRQSPPSPSLSAL